MFGECVFQYFLYRHAEVIYYLYCAKLIYGCSSLYNYREGEAPCRKKEVVSRLMELSV